VLQFLDEIKRWEMGFSVQPVAVVVAGIIGREPEVMAFNRSLQASVAQKTGAVGNDVRDDIIFINPNQVLAYPADFRDRLRPNPMDYHSMAKVWRQAPIQNYPLEKCPKVRRPRNSWFVSRVGQRRRASCLIAARDLYCYCG